MSDIGTGYLRKVVIESANGKKMGELDFELRFYIYDNKIQAVKKEDLVRVVKDGEEIFYAKIHSEKLGRGEVKCMVIIQDPEPRWDGMKRPVVLKRSVGIVVGECGCLRTKNECCGFEEGYNVRFEEADDIPMQDAKAVRYGVLGTNVSSFADITELMVLDFIVADGLKNLMLNVNVGDKVVVLVDADLPNVATKNNGLGEFVPFSTDVLGANGEYTLEVEKKYYRVYGEMMLVSGELCVNLND